MLSPARYAARAKSQLPNVFDGEASCDLDRDGFTDLIVSTDPPYDGQGRPVPLQVLFGSPGSLTRAVELTVPAVARFGNDWPDQPVCGDFDGDGAQDLVLHASGEQLNYLRGLFSRTGTPRAADVNRNGYDDLVVRAPEGESKACVVLGRFGRGVALDAAVGTLDETSLRTTSRPPPAPTLRSPGSGLRVLPCRTTGLSTAGTVTVEPPARGPPRCRPPVTGTGTAD